MLKHGFIQEFNPQRVEIFLDNQGRQKLALLTFKNDVHGLGDARAYDESFTMSHHGRTDWYTYCKNHSTTKSDLYGWQAIEEVDL